MTFTNYYDFCENAEYFKKKYKNVEKTRTTQLENAYRKCWQDYVYNLKIRYIFKNLIWDYLNDSIDLEQLKIYYE